MPECVCLPKCIFFNDKMVDMPTTTERMKQRYCLNDYNNCARYKVFSTLGKEHVPSDLYPHNVDRAMALITAGGK
jgi:hypothetical protein